MAKNFLKSFKENFLQSTIIWIIMLIVGVVIVGDFFLLPNMFSPDSTIYTGLFSVFCLAAFVYLMILVYLFPLQAKLENKIRHTFKNALLLGFRHLPYTVLFIAVLVGSIWAMNSFLIISFVWVVIAVAAIAYGCSFLYDKIFKIYIKPEDLGLEPEAESIEETEQ